MYAQLDCHLLGYSSFSKRYSSEQLIKIQTTTRLSSTWEPLKNKSLEAEQLNIKLKIKTDLHFNGISSIIYLLDTRHMDFTARYQHRWTRFLEQRRKKQNY